MASTANDTGRAMTTTTHSDKPLGFPYPEAGV